MNSIERLEEVVHDIEKKPYGWRFPVGTIETHLETIGECLPALIAVAKAAEKQSNASCALTEYSHRRNKTDEEWGRLASKVTVADRELFDALAKLKGVE